MQRNQRLVLVASILGSFVAFLDMAVVNVALPAIRAQLGGGFSSQQWVVDAYLLTLGSTILIAGSLADLFGRKRVFALGLVGFAATSVLCALAPNASILIAARALQGAAGALLVPSSLALIMATFTGPAQGEAVGTWTAWTGVAFLVGPLAGGLLVDAGSWRWVFAINVVPVAATLLVLSRVVTESTARGPVRAAEIDVAGAALCAGGLGGVIFALIEAPARGWRDPWLVVALVSGVLGLAGFLARERFAKHPILDLGLFRARNFAIGNLATVLIYAGLNAAMFLITLFLQQVARYSAVQAGMALVPVTVLMFTLSPLFGRLAGKLGPRLFMTIGPCVAGVGFALMTGVGPHTRYFEALLPGVLVFGLGLSATVAPLTAATLGDVDQRHAGVASAVNNAIARVAGLLAVAALGVILAARFAAEIDARVEAHPRLPYAARSFLDEARHRPLETAVPPAIAARAPAVRAILDDASVSAFRHALWWIAALPVAGGLLSAIGIRNPARKT